MTDVAERKLIMAASPHQQAKDNTRRIMLDVIIALLPALICGTVFFGLYSLMLVVICTITCVIAEQLVNLIRKKPFTNDLSAIVTGMILGMNLPARADWYVAVIGGVFAIVLVKMLFGGLGKNFANPAACARVFLMLAYATMSGTFISVNVGANFFAFGSDYTIAATYLGKGTAALQGSFMGAEGYWGYVLQLFFGSVAGCIGETSSLAILLGGVYLVCRRVIDWRIPAVYILTSILMTLILYRSSQQILLQLFSGGLMFAAVFMATDYATSPKWEANRVLFAIGIGVITMVVRKYGNYPEGASGAILIMNLLVPMMDKYLRPVRYGEKNKKGMQKRDYYKAATLIVCLAMIVASIILSIVFWNANTVNSAVVAGGVI